MKRGIDERGLPRKPWLVAVLALAYLLIVAGIFIIGNLAEKAPEPEPVFGNLDERFAPTITMEYNGQSRYYYENQFTNLLIIGVDRNHLSSDAQLHGGRQADFLLLLSISRHGKTITPIHIDRDTIAEVDVYGIFGDPVGKRSMQLCLSYNYGTDDVSSSENTVAAVQRLFHDIPIDYYITMDMQGIATLNDALGGVTVTLEEDFSHLDPEMKAGETITLKGAQAEYYVRGRQGVGDYSNSQRMKHQRNYINTALPQLYEILEDDPLFFNRLLEDMSDHLCTNVTQSWILDHSYALENYEVEDILSLEGTHYAGRGGFMEFHPDEDALKKLLANVFFSSAA